MTTTKTKKIVLFNLGDIRDVSWELNATKGLDLLKKLREAGFSPEDLSPYIQDGGDVPMLIRIKLEGGRNEVKKNLNLLETIVGESSFQVLDQKEYDNFWGQDWSLE